jgi:hypothetical protein
MNHFPTISDFFAANRKRNEVVFCCFSPPVMIATVIVEVALAIITAIRYRKELFGKVSIAILLLLAAFQVSEYQVCGNNDGAFWSRFGLVAITLLPVLGFYLITFITRNKRFLIVGSALAAAFVIYFIFAPAGTVNAFCGGNYVIFGGPTGLYELFGAYYFGFLILSIWEALAAARESRNRTLKSVLRWIVIGYLSFILPLAIVYAFYAPARIAIASIMCGFAVIFAFILAFEITPRFHTLKTQRLIPEKPGQ